MILLDELFHSFLISSETFLPSCLCRRYISNIIIIDILIILNSEVVKYSINKRSQPSLASSHQSTVSWLCKFTEIHFGDPWKFEARAQPWRNKSVGLKFEAPGIYHPTDGIGWQNQPTFLCPLSFVYGTMPLCSTICIVLKLMVYRTLSISSLNI